MVEITTVRMVRRVIFRSSRKKAAMSSGMLITSVSMPTGRAVSCAWVILCSFISSCIRCRARISRAMPEATPGAILHGSTKHQTPTAWSSPPRMSQDQSINTPCRFIHLISGSSHCVVLPRLRRFIYAEHYTQRRRESNSEKSKGGFKRVLTVPLPDTPPDTPGRSQ